MFQEIVAAIRARLEGASLTADLSFPNETYEPTYPAPWIYAEVEASGADCTAYNSAGKRQGMEMVVLFAHVFVATGNGLAPALAIAKEVADLFRAETFAAEGFRIVCGAPVVANAESGSDDGLWFRVTVSCPMTALYAI